MDSKAAYSHSYTEESLQINSLDFHQEQSYFPPQWQDDPIEFNIDDHELDLSLLQGHASRSPASTLPLSRSSTDDSSPCSSVTSKLRSDETLPKKKQDRRRAQNRAAQRAYRERKEQLRQELEVQVKMWQDRHQTLRESYVDQAQEVQRLKKHIEKLHVQLLGMHDTGLPDNTSLCDFDLWPDLAWKSQ